MYWYVLVTYLEWFTDSNDALQSIAVVAQHTLCSPHRDFLFTNIYLQTQTNLICDTYLSTDNVSL